MSENYPRFSGGEPSLNTTALEIAAKHWQHGIIYTNGIKKVPVHVPFRIALSIWGAKDSNQRLRGGPTVKLCKPRKRISAR